MIKNNKTYITVLGIIIFFIFIYIIQPLIESNIKIITFSIILILLEVYLMRKKIKKEKIDIKNIIYLIIIVGILIRAMYIIYTPITERQHDVYSIEDQGHLGYIYTIYETGKIPETNSIQFYHPPLFHAIAAGWLEVNTILNVDFNRALEGIQILTAIFSSFILIVSYKIVQKIEIKEIYKLLIISLMSFHPTFIILAGSINNDILMILLSFCIILYLIEWKENTTLKNTILLAMFTGCSVMTKVSGAIMAVPIIITFIDKISEKLKLKKDKKGIINVFSKIMLFGIISLPLGLWHPIRNAILFGQPLGGVLLPLDKLYIGNYSYMQRFFTLSFKELIDNIYCTIPGDYNVLAFIIKTSVLGEFYYSNMSFIATILKVINLLLIIISLFATIIVIGKTSKNNKNYTIIKILLFTWFINIISYYAFNIQYPYLCTMDFRYIVPTIFSGIIFTTIILDKYIEKTYLKKLIEYTVIIFCILSYSMFFLI